MAQAITDCGHDDMIHDIALDSSGKRLATCSSDKTINIHEIDQQGTQRLIEKLKGHEGAVWSVGWAPQEYGSILASASYDAKVFIWREQGGQWQRIFDSGLHKASVNCVDWAPYESGCLLACASSDGHVSVLEFKDNNMSHLIIPAHGAGVNSVSWAPAVSPGSIAAQSPNPSQPQTPQRRFVTGGCDNLLRIWAWDPASQTYQAEPDVLAGHTDWVRDVDWSPTVLQKSYIASASQDKTVRIWTKDAQSASAQWECKVLTFDSVMWHVEWSPTGNVLAVGSGDNKVSLWNENLRGEWQCIKTADE